MPTTLTLQVIGAGPQNDQDFIATKEWTNEQAVPILLDAVDSFQEGPDPAGGAPPPELTNEEKIDKLHQVLIDYILDLARDKRRRDLLVTHRAEIAQSNTDTDLEYP